MLIKFALEFQGCSVNRKPQCPYLHVRGGLPPKCALTKGDGVQAVRDNRHALTESCVMVRKTFQPLY